jgi:hypothetical protein
MTTPGTALAVLQYRSMLETSGSGDTVPMIRSENERTVEENGEIT